MNRDATLSLTSGWDHYWFAPRSIHAVAVVRSLLCCVAMVYFAAAFSDISFWYADAAPMSPQNVSGFWQAAGLESEIRWMISPLFLTSSAWIYQGYLLLGIALSIIVLAGRGGRAAGWLLWLALVGWANRIMFLTGLVESLLSLGLFAVAIAPPANVWNRTSENHWSAGLAIRLLTAEITIVGLVTIATMLAGGIWFSGEGAYALAAPYQDRTIDLTASGSLLNSPIVYESLTHFLVLALLVGMWLAWQQRTKWIGLGLLLVWCLTIAVLGSLWLYAMTFAIFSAALALQHASPQSDSAPEPTA